MRRPQYMSGGKCGAVTSPPPPPIVTLLLEDFPEANGTVINLKAPQIGNIWHANILPAQGNDTNCLKINAAHQSFNTVNNAHGTAITDLGQGSYTITVVCQLINGHNLASYVVTRVVNVGTFLACAILSNDAVSIIVQLQEVVDSQFNAFGGVNVSVADGSHTISVGINSDTVTVALDGSTLFTDNTSAIGIGSHSAGYAQYVDPANDYQLSTINHVDARG